MFFRKRYGFFVRFTGFVVDVRGYFKFGLMDDFGDKGLRG